MTTFNLKKYLEKNAKKSEDATLTEHQLRNTGKTTPKEPEQISEAQLAKQRSGKDPDTVIEKQLEKVRKESGSETLIEKQLDSSKSKIVSHRSDTYSGNVNKLEEQRLAGKPVEKEKYEDAATTDKKKMFPEVKGKDGLKTAGKMTVKADLKADIFEVLDQQGAFQKQWKPADYMSFLSKQIHGISQQQVQSIMNEYLASKKQVAQAPVAGTPPVAPATSAPLPMSSSKQAVKTAQSAEYWLGEEENDDPDLTPRDIDVDTIVESPIGTVIKDDDFEIDDLDDDEEDELDKAIEEATKGVEVPGESELNAIEKGDLEDEPTDQAPVFTITTPTRLDAGGTELIQVQIQFDPFVFDSDDDAVQQALAWMSAKYPSLDMKKIQKGMTKDVAGGRLTFVLPGKFEKMFE